MLRLNSLVFVLVAALGCSESKEEAPVVSRPSSNIEDVGGSGALGISPEKGAKIGDVAVDERNLRLGLYELAHKLAQMCSKDNELLRFRTHQGAANEKRFACVGEKGIIQAERSLLSKVDATQSGPLPWFIRTAYEYAFEKPQAGYTTVRFLRYLGDCQNIFGRGDFAGFLLRETACVELSGKKDSEARYFKASIDFIDSEKIRIIPDVVDEELFESALLNIHDGNIFTNGELMLIRFVDIAKADVFNRELKFLFLADSRNLAAVLSQNQVFARFICREPQLEKKEGSMATSCTAKVFSDALNAATVFETRVLWLKDNQYRLFFTSKIDDSAFVDFEI